MFRMFTMKDITLILRVHLKGQTVIAGNMFPSFDISLECSSVVPPALIMKKNKTFQEEYIFFVIFCKIRN